VLLAEIARCGADVGRDGRMAELDHNDVFERPAACLIEAVLQLAGRDIGGNGPARSLAAPCDDSALSAEHLKYREIVAEIARFEGANYPPKKSTAESEAVLNTLADEAMALESKAWATPAKTLADVLLRGEIALYNENGVMESLDDAEAYYDERAVAQLIRAVVDVLGGAMHPDPILSAVRVTNPRRHILRHDTSQVEYLILDPMAKLEQGCTVAAFLTGHFMLVGRIERSPTGAC
jgi:hypothetical protein